MQPLSRSPVPLGKSGLSVSPLAWGMWRLAGADVPTAAARVHAALDAGITFLDTAAIYGADGPGFGAAESLLGEVFAADSALRARVTLATKGGIVPGVPYDTSAAYLARTIDQSLARLRTDIIDLFMIHRPDPLGSPAETAHALDAAIAAGKVRAVGVSNYSPAQLRALAAHLQAPIAVNQIEYSPLEIAPLSDGGFDLAAELGYAIMAWSPLGGGRLAEPSGLWQQSVARALDAVADKHDVSPTAAAYAWIMAHPLRPIPIVGTQHPARITDAADAFKIEWTRAEWYAVLTAARGERLP